MVQLLTQEQGTMEMDNTWSVFIQTKVNSFTKWDLLHFFHDNPHAQDSAENIASFIGKETSSVRHALEDLCRTAILECDTRSGEVIYRLTTRKEVHQTVNDFIKACHNREFRAKAIYTVLKSK